MPPTVIPASHFTHTGCWQVEQAGSRRRSDPDIAIAIAFHCVTSWSTFTHTCAPRPSIPAVAAGQHSTIRGTIRAPPPGLPCSLPLRSAPGAPPDQSPRGCPAPARRRAARRGCASCRPAAPAAPATSCSGKRGEGVGCNRGGRGVGLAARGAGECKSQAWLSSSACPAVRHGQSSTSAGR